MVPAFQMGIFCGQEQVKMMFFLDGRHVNTGFNETQDERAVDIGSDPNPFFQLQGGLDPPAQPPVADSGIKEKDNHASQPDKGSQLCPNLQRIGRGSGCR